MPAGLLGERGTFSPAGKLNPSWRWCPSVRSWATPPLVLPAALGSARGARVHGGLHTPECAVAYGLRSQHTE